MSVVKITCHSVGIDLATPHQIKDHNTSIGTGFLIGENKILTCYHVIDSAIRLKISWKGLEGSELDAEVLMSYPEADLALIQLIDKDKIKDLPRYTLGNSDKVKKLDKVTAIGYQLGENMITTTKGVVSRRLGHLIQTDTAINPGNSGGPLLDENDEVMGIVSSKVMFTDNIGYVVPINQYKAVQECSGYIIKPTLCLTIQYNSDSILKYKNIDKDDSDYNGGGVVITTIYEMSPLKLILNPGDILYQFDQYDIDFRGNCAVSWYDEKIPLNDILYRYKVGSSVPIKYIQDGKCIEKKIVLKEIKPPIRTIFNNLDPIEYCIFGGMIVVPMTLNSLSKRLSYHVQTRILPEKRHLPCLYISKILVGSNLKTSEMLSENMIVAEVNNIEVHTIDQYKAALTKVICTTHHDVIIWKTIDDRIYVCDVDLLLKEEEMLSKHFKYEPIIRCP